ncbi:hypothetical protein [Aurantimonas marina]|uniref:hypothetical protein n=1 Tax=Aurantimonas marina TaxID=2780508 RepID=UPI0019D2AF99|nr:hypothetical protein [Aurantimonas marina]
MMYSSKFDHPKHGSYPNPEAVLKDDNLSESEKQTVLKEWADSLKHILHNEPDASEVKATKQSLDEATERLASGRT